MADVVTVEDLGVPVVTSTEDETGGVEVTDARWITLMSPDLAEDLAVMLEAFTELRAAGLPNLQEALNLARKINRHRDETPLI